MEAILGAVAETSSLPNTVTAGQLARDSLGFNRQVGPDEADGREGLLSRALRWPCGGLAVTLLAMGPVRASNDRAVCRILDALAAGRASRRELLRNGRPFRRASLFCPAPRCWFDRQLGATPSQGAA